jgi:vitamin B12 transporter
MKKQLLIVGVLACSFVSTSLFAQKKEKQKEKVEILDEIVVTATKFKLKKEQIGKVIYTISQKEIVNNAGKTVVDLLNNIPGIEIKGSNSNPSEPRSTYVRGGRSRQVLILIDGVPVSDPSLINQEYDLRLLSLNQIQSIEVLKGASSTLYGSGAATGVINIILKKASKNTVSGSYEVTVGSNNDAESTNSILSDKNQNVNLSGSFGKFNFLSSFNLTGTNGLSAAKSKTNTDFEEDSYYSKNGLLKLGYTFNKKLSIETFFNFDEFEYDYDTGIWEDSDINNGEQTQLRFGARPSYKYNKGEVYLLASFNNVKRTDNNFSTFSNVINTSVFKGESTNLDLVNKYSFSKEFQLITGLNYQKHTNNATTPFGDIDKKIANFDTLDPYASLVYVTDAGLTLNVGGRLNMHSNYGNHLVYDANASYQFLKNSDFELRGLTSYSTAFIAPSTYQLFSVYGNTDLKPETSNTFELGFDSSYKKIVNFTTVYFNRVENEAIIFNNLNVAPYGIYGNSTETVKLSGVESVLTIKPFDKLKLTSSYTFTDKSVDVDYIPKHKFITNVEYYLTENSFVALTFKNVGDRFARYYDNSTFSTVETTLQKYNLLDFNTNYKLAEGTVTLLGSVTNLLNESYDDILGFSTRGRNFKVGVRLQF